MFHIYACLNLLKIVAILFVSVLTAGYLDTLLNPQYPLVSENNAEGYHPPPDSQTITPDHGLDCNEKSNMMVQLTASYPKILTSHVSFIGYFLLKHLKPFLHLCATDFNVTVFILPCLSVSDARHLSRLISILQKRFRLWNYSKNIVC